MTTTQHPTSELLERTAEVEEARGAIDQVRSGQGRTLLIEGHAGIGKTALLRAVTELAGQAGLAVQTARGDELETGFPFGVMRQLLTEPVGDLDAATLRRLRRGPGSHALSLVAGRHPRGDRGTGQNPDADSESGLSEAYSFCALVLALSHDRPTLWCVDDAHSADLSSLRALYLLTRRLDAVPCLVVLAARTPPIGDSGAFLGRITADPRTGRLRPAPLAPKGVGKLARRLTGEDLSHELKQGLWRATSGNPFLVRELLTSLEVVATDELSPDPEALAELAPDSIVRFALRRIDALGGPARRLAEAVAVLGRAALVDAAALAEVEERAALVAADRLASHQIVSAGRHLSMVHPVLREAVRRAIPPARRAMLHSRAARLLDRNGAPAERVGGHLLEGLPRADPWVVDRLRAAARIARQQGAPEAASSLLARALEEPARPSVRFEVATELGTAQVAHGDPGAISTLERAIGWARDPSEQVAATVRLARALGMNGDIRRGLELVHDLDPTSGAVDAELMLQLESELLGFARLHADTRPSALARLDELAERAFPARPASAVLLANLALTAVERREPPARIAQLAEAALVDDALIDAGSFQLAYAVGALTWIDRYEQAADVWDHVIETADRRGSVSLAGVAHAIRSRLHLRWGRVQDAEGDARTAHEIIVATDRRQGAPYSRAHLADALLERGRVDEAATILESAERAEHAESVPDYLDSLGRLALARHDPQAALDQFLACGDALRVRGGVDAPSIVAWRSHAAIAAQRSGDTAAAGRLAREELDLATSSQVDGSIGRALLTLGTVEDDTEILTRAVRTLEDTPRTLTTVQALIALGSTLRRRGERRAARPHLARALDLAHRCQATALAKGARAELHAAGARPRREALHGPGALTPSERRVAALAAAGLTNREIAAELFVSVRTVTTHLTHVYQKLQITGRTELPGRLSQN